MRLQNRDSTCCLQRISLLLYQVSYLYTLTGETHATTRKKEGCMYKFVEWIYKAGIEPAFFSLTD